MQKRSFTKSTLIAMLERLPVELAVLFGSAARGQMRPGSDVDVGIRVERDNREVRNRVQAAIARALRQQPDVISLDEAPRRDRPVEGEGRSWSGVISRKGRSLGLRHAASSGGGNRCGEDDQR